MDKPSYTHFIAIDFGTYGCGIAVYNVKNELEEKKIRVFSHWAQSMVPVKSPTILLLDHEGKFEAFGDAALKSYQAKKGHPDKEDQYYLFYRFKMCLYENKVVTLVSLFGCSISVNGISFGTTSSYDSNCPIYSYIRSYIAT